MAETLVIIDQASQEGMQTSFFQLEAPPGHQAAYIVVNQDHSVMSPSIALQEPVVNGILLFENTEQSSVVFTNIMNAGPPTNFTSAFLALDATGNAPIVTSFDRKEGFGLISGSEIVIAVANEDRNAFEQYQNELLSRDMTSNSAYSGYTGKKHEVG